MRSGHLACVIVVAVLAAAVLIFAGGEILGGFLFSEAEPGSRASVVFEARSGLLEIPVEIADDPDEIGKGLMFRQRSTLDGGMLFLFRDENPRSFWMKNTLFPLDMIFLDSGRRIVKIHSSAMPCHEEPCPTYSSPPSMYVIEVPGGFCSRNRVTEGSFVGLKIPLSG